MRPLLATFSSVALALALFAAAGAQTQADVTASVTLTPDTGTVGDRLILTIAVDHPGGVTITGAPAFGDDFGGLELLDVATPSTIELQPGRQRTSFVYTLTSFQTGAFTIPAFQLVYDGGSVSTEPRAARIDTVLQPGDETLRPLKPQLEIPEPAPSPVVPAAFVGAMALLTLAGYVLYARTVALRPAAVAAGASVVTLSPADHARATLDALAASGIEDSDPAEYYARIAGTVRRYLSERYAFAAFAMTHTEMERGMAAAGIDRFPTRVAANLLEQCEAVEFARFRPAPERRAADLAAAYELIELTSEPQAGIEFHNVTPVQ